jgi:hypothetical protein
MGGGHRGWVLGMMNTEIILLELYPFGNGKVKLSLIITTNSTPSRERYP